MVIFAYKKIKIGELCTELKTKNKQKKEGYKPLCEKDFYPPEDNRYVRSGVSDMDMSEYKDFWNDYWKICKENDMCEE